jgi:hypothetical protein
MHMDRLDKDNSFTARAPPVRKDTLPLCCPSPVCFLCVPCSLDDATYATLSSLMLFNNVDVVLGLYQDAAFLPRVSTVGGQSTMYSSQCARSATVVEQHPDCYLRA